MRPLRFRPLFLAALFLLLGAGSSARASEPLTIFAAASLKDVLEAISVLPDFPADPPILNFASSAILARQLAQGARADIFISADGDWMAYLAAQGLIKEDSRRTIASNRLVLIAPFGQAPQVTLSQPESLILALGGERLALAETNSVPAGRYAKAALQSLGIWDELQAQLLPAENVRAAMKLVESGEAPLGIVYVSDAIAEPGVVQVAAFDPTSYPAIHYPAAILVESGNGQAGAFLDFLATPSAQAVFAQKGFLPPGE